MWSASSARYCLLAAAFAFALALAMRCVVPLPPLSRYNRKAVGFAVLGHGHRNGTGALREASTFVQMFAFALGTKALAFVALRSLGLGLLASTASLHPSELLFGSHKSNTIVHGRV